MPRGRPRLGAAVKSVVASIRLDEYESRDLRSEHGTTSKALRTLVDREVQRIRRNRKAPE